MSTSDREDTFLESERLRARGATGSVSRRSGRTSLHAREAWTAIVQAVMSHREYLSSEAAKLDLTLPQAHLLRLLKSGPPRTMTSIAGALGCDASNVTGIVDRLEARGLIERKGSKDDRRIKTLHVTAAGASIVDALKQKMFEPPDGFARLQKAEVATLHSLLARIFPGSSR
jgi:DNA-binding MarR family transcriptional regulator